VISEMRLNEPVNGKLSAIDHNQGRMSFDSLNM
jgi:hypothetical protein